MLGAGCWMLDAGTSCSLLQDKDKDKDKGTPPEQDRTTVWVSVHMGASLETSVCWLGLGASAVIHYRELTDCRDQGDWKCP